MLWLELSTKEPFRPVIFSPIKSVTLSDVKRLCSTITIEKMKNNEDFTLKSKIVPQYSLVVWTTNCIGHFLQFEKFSWMTKKHLKSFAFAIGNYKWSYRPSINDFIVDFFRWPISWKYLILEFLYQVTCLPRYLPITQIMFMVRFWPTYQTHSEKTNALITEHNCSEDGQLTLNIKFKENLPGCL